MRPLRHDPIKLMRDIALQLYFPSTALCYYAQLSFKQVIWRKTIDEKSYFLYHARGGKCCARRAAAPSPIGM